MDNRVNVAGIYNLEILKSSIANGVKNFTFDLRPSSFNFIQEYVLLELLEYISLRDTTIYLHFEGEADFVIQKIVKDIRQVMASRGKLELIFSDNNSIDYYEQFQTPFHMVLKSNQVDPKLIESKQLAGLIFPMDMIEAYGLKTCLKLIGAAKNVNPGRIISTEVRYDKDKILDTHKNIPTDQHFFTIGSNLEVAYRQVDSIRIKKHLSSLIRA
jgi:hypothetical protein